MQDKELYPNVKEIVDEMSERNSENKERITKFKTYNLFATMGKLLTDVRKVITVSTNIMPQMHHQYA